MMEYFWKEELLKDPKEVILSKKINKWLYKSKKVVERDEKTKKKADLSDLSSFGQLNEEVSKLIPDIGVADRIKKNYDKQLNKMSSQVKERFKPPKQFNKMPDKMHKGGFLR